MVSPIKGRKHTAAFIAPNNMPLCHYVRNRCIGYAWNYLNLKCKS